MSNIQSKIIRHTKRLENLIPNQEKYCSIKTDPNITQSIKFADKYDKTAIINGFHMLMQVKENMNIMRRGVKSMKYSQVKFLKIKKYICNKKYFGWDSLMISQQRKNINVLEK